MFTIIDIKGENKMNGIPTIEEIEKDYKEWALGLLKTYLALRPEAFDEHHTVNFSYENVVDCLWHKIKNFTEEHLWLQDQYDKLDKHHKGEREFVGKCLLDNTRKFAELTIDFEIMIDKAYELAEKETAEEIQDYIYQNHLMSGANRAHFELWLKEKFGAEV